MPLSHEDRVVLVVDDEDEHRELLQTLLEDEGYDVRTAADGLEAIDFMQTVRPAFVLLDLTMPNMSGWQVAERMKDDPSLNDVPICAMAEPADLAPSDVQFVLMKPVAIDALLDVLRDHL